MSASDWPSNWRYLNIGPPDPVHFTDFEGTYCVELTPDADFDYKPRGMKRHENSLYGRGAVRRHSGGFDFYQLGSNKRFSPPDRHVIRIINEKTGEVVFENPDYKR